MSVVCRLVHFQYTVLPECIESGAGSFSFQAGFLKRRKGKRELRAAKKKIVILSYYRSAGSDSVLQVHFSLPTSLLTYLSIVYRALARSSIAKPNHRRAWSQRWPSTRVTERDTREHVKELSSLREEVVYASALAREHSKERFDAKTSEWKDESLLHPGKKVWIEIRDVPYPTAAYMPTPGSPTSP